MFDKYVSVIRENGGIDTKIIAQIIKEHEPKRQQLILRYERYKQSETMPIYNRDLPEAGIKIDNQIANDWFSEIVDTKTGYMFGVPLGISIDQKVSWSEEAEKRIDRFRKLNIFDDVIAENAKSAIIGGYDPILAYIDTDGNERFMRLDPWEVCIISETNITEPVFALRYYKTYDGTHWAEFYDSSTRMIFKGKSYETLENISNALHMFDYCPLYATPNNEELMGDADKVLDLIDDYDRVVSDFSSEIEQFRLAYMLMYGVMPSDSLLDDLKRTGIMYIPEADKDMTPPQVEYLTKTIDVNAIKEHLDRIEKNIVRFAKHVNFSDAAFGGDLTGPAMRFKLFMLEAKSIVMERKHHSSIMYLFKVIGSAWKKRGIPDFDYMDLDIKYTRNIPVNVLDQVNTAKATLGMTSLYTTLSAMPALVPDVDAELRRIEEESSGEVDLDDPELNDNIQTGDSVTNNDGTRSGVDVSSESGGSAMSGRADAPAANARPGAV